MIDTILMAWFTRLQTYLCPLSAQLLPLLLSLLLLLLLLLLHMCLEILPIVQWLARVSRKNLIDFFFSMSYDTLFILLLLIRLLLIFVLVNGHITLKHRLLFNQRS